MSFDRDLLFRLIAAHGPVVRVVVAETAGSAPREVGAAMHVWAGGQEGTIGGGTLEFQAAGRARRLLAAGEAAALDRLPLGPALGQCCGGAVVLLSERWDAARLRLADGPLVVRPLPGRGADKAGGWADDGMPLAVRRILTRARGQGVLPPPRLVHGWFIEAVRCPGRPLWVWGAGHVGRAIVATLAPLPDLAITWVDTDAARFPALPDGVRQITDADPATRVAEAPVDADHLVLTFSHALDMELCHRLLGHGFSSLGLIGSETKWARFRSRLAALGHGSDQIGRITCPIGDPSFGKHPQAIAIGVAARLLGQRAARQALAPGLHQAQRG